MRRGGEFERLLDEIEGLGEDETPFEKSFPVVARDGTRLQAIDGTRQVASLESRIADQEFAVIKSLRQIVDIVKSQSAQLAKLAKARAPKAPSMSHIEFFAKALTAQAEGKICGLDVAKAEACLNQGKPVPVEIVRAVTGDITATANAAPRSISSGAFFAKALAAQAAGRVSGFEIAKAEAAINRGRAPEGALVRRVLIGHAGTLA